MRFNTIEVKKRMLDCGINSFKELSERSGISYPTIKKIFDNKGVPTIGTLEKLAEALSVPKSEISSFFFTYELT